MNDVHRIRLRGPWEVIALSAGTSADLPAPTRMTMPCCWRDGGWPGFHGRALHRRAFGMPTGLGPTDRVYLTIAGVAGSGVIRMNGEALGTIDESGPFAVDVTGQLNSRNLLEVEIAATADSGGLTGEVALEIRNTTA